MKRTPYEIVAGLLLIFGLNVGVAISLWLEAAGGDIVLRNNLALRPAARTARSPASATSKEQVELTILMPCLNEAETLVTCIRKAKQFLAASGIEGEVLVADNGSTDGPSFSPPRKARGPCQFAPAAMERLFSAASKPHAAVMSSWATRIDSYDFSDLGSFVNRLRNGARLVMGNRFHGGIAPGAMPFLHRYLGNPVLSWLGRLFFYAPVGDFHCGLRGFHRDSIKQLNLRTTGMEFASEMVVRSALAGYQIAEVPTTLRKDGRSRPPHLRTWRDGWRHLSFLLMYSPKWLFLYPGLLLLALGLVGGFALITWRSDCWPRRF